MNRVLSAALLLFALPAAAAERTFTLRYSTTVQAPAGQPIDVWIPLPPSTPAQDVVSAKVEGPLKGVEGTEPRFGNRYWRAHLDASDGKPIELALVATVRRRTVE